MLPPIECKVDIGGIYCCNEAPTDPDTQRLSPNHSAQVTYRTLRMDIDQDGQMGSSKMSRKQIFCLIIMAYGHFCIAASDSLQGPFFPGECDIKGVSSLVYGLIFGVFELIVTSMPLIDHKMFAYVTPHFALRFGLFLTGTTTVLFGVLDKVTIAHEFAVFALLLRIGQGVGFSAFISSCYYLRKSEFSEHSVDPLTILGIASSLGFLLGSPIGGALIMVGGYIMPFVIFGSLTLFASLISIVILTKPDNYPLISYPISPSKYSNKFAEVLVIAGPFALTGFNDVTLAHHLSQFHLSPVEIGSIFMIIWLAFLLLPALCCKLGNLVFGSLWTSILGTVIIIIGLLLIGPASFIPIEPELWLIILSLIIIGIGLRAQKLSPTSVGFNKWVKALPSIAAFIGPVIGGYLIGTIGYRAAVEVALALEIITLLLLIVHKIRNRRAVVEPC